MDQQAPETPSTSPASWSVEDSDYSDCEPDLSELPSDLDGSVLKQPVRPVSNTSWPSSTHRHQFPHHPKRSFSTFATDKDVFDESPASKFTKIAKVNHDPQLGHLAPFEKAPAEVLQKIAAFACSDRDIASMALLSKRIAYSILPADSTIWRTRLLAKYDHPIVPSPLDFSLAYKLRRFVLDARNFVNFKDNNDKRLPIQMEVLRDLVMETYHNPTPWHPPPQSSKNLQRMYSPSTSPWIKIFLSSPFYGYGSANFGHENALFEALQLTLSYLILSPKSRVARIVQTSRDHYDLARVYNYNCPLTTLFARLPEPMHDHFLRPPTKFQSRIFPNLYNSRRSSNQRPKEIKYAVDLNTLLHIRNFWHRHLIDARNTNNLNSESGERTYASMAKALMRLGYTPKEWMASLQDPLGNLEGIKSGVWHGHYTCLQPWPKSARDLEEQQTAAEEWIDVAPLKLDFTASTDNSSFTWPPIFSSIPAFESTSPTGNDLSPSSSQTGDRPTFYLRGIAPFINLEEAERRHQSRKNRPTAAEPPRPRPPSTSKKSRSKPSSSSLSSPSSSEKSMFLHHPFTSLRLRGIVHPIPSGLTPIPGFYRVIFVLFRPQTHYLISVLVHAEESSSSSSSSSSTNGQGSSPTTIPTTMPPQLLQQTTDDDDLPDDPVEREKALRAHLKAKLKTSVSTLDGKRVYTEDEMTRDRICALEDSYAGESNGPLYWLDIDYAYAYEGVIVPGGRLMMGKWWRIGEGGSGPAMELDCEGFPVDDDDDDDGGEGSGQGGEGDEQAAAAKEGVDTTTTRRRSKGLERGAFCFWA